MAYADKSPLSRTPDDELGGCWPQDLAAEIILFRKALAENLARHGHGDRQACRCDLPTQFLPKRQPDAN